MELRHYFAILRRSWPLVVGLPLLVALVSIASALTRPPRYGVQVAMLITQRPMASNEAALPLPDYNSYHSWATSEFIVDDMLQLAGSGRFASDIAAWIAQQRNVTIDPGAIKGGISAERKHRTVTLSIQADRAENAVYIAQGAVEMMRQHGLQYWQRDGQLDVSVLDEPTTAGRVGGRSGLIVDVAIRTILALLLAVGLAFLRHYLDQTVRQRDDVEALGLEVVGAIPLAKGAR